MDYAEKNDVAAALEYAEENGPAEPMGEEIMGIPRALVVPNSRRVQSMKDIIDAFRTHPERMRGTARLLDLDSFIAHVKRMVSSRAHLLAIPGSIVYATKDPPSLTAVYDYGSPADPDNMAHRAVYNFPISPAWARWIGAVGKSLTARSFAELIEDGIVDIADPSIAGEQACRFVSLLGCALATPARMVELSRGLTVREKTKVHAATNLSTGETQVQYISEHTNEKGEPLNVPGAFLLVLQPFDGADAYQIPVRLRYRVVEQSITWSIEPWRYDAVLDCAVRDAVARVRSETGLEVLLGSPERP